MADTESTSTSTSTEDNMAYTFGIAATIGGSGYLIQSFSKNSQADTAEARDNNGDVKDLTTYNEREEVSYEAIVPTGTTAPTVGSTMTYDGATYLITAATETQSNTDYLKFSVTAIRYTVNSIPSAT